MSEEPESISPELVPKPVQDYLALATSELLKAGVASHLKHDVETTNRWFKEMSEEDTGDPQQWIKSQAETFYNAELPLCVTKDDDTGNEAWFGVTKVDERGHAYLAHRIILFELNPDGTQKQHDPNDPTEPMEVSQDLISAVRQLYQRQEELGWQPKIDIKDTPESTELAAQA